MSQQIIEITTCDGCGKSDYPSDLEFVDRLTIGERLADLCENCDERGGFICHECVKIHFAKWSCPSYVREAKTIIQSLAA